jgi:hypothetical protein
VDLSKLTPGEMLAAGGGAVLIISLFLDWTSVSGFGGASAFDQFSGMHIILLLVGVAALVFAATSASGTPLELPVKPSSAVLLLGVGALGFVFGFDLENENAGIGAWLALFATIAIVVGASRVPSDKGAVAPS